MNTVHISRRELEVLDLISLGFTTKQISNVLHVSDNTILTHRKKLLSKMKVPNMPSLIRKSFELGIMSTTEN